MSREKVSYFNPFHVKKVYVLYKCGLEYDATTLSVISDVLDLDVHRTVPSRASPSPHRGLTAERPGSMETSHLNFIKRGELTDQDA